MELVVQEQRKLARFALWLKLRYEARAARDTFVWRVASGSLILFGAIAMFTAVMGMPTGLGTFADSLIFITANTLAIGLSAFIVSIVLAFAYVPVPRQFTAVFAYAGTETYLILYYAEFGVFMSVVLAAIYSAAGAASGLLLGALFRWRTKTSRKWLTAMAAALIAALTLSLSDWPRPASVPQRDEAAIAASYAVSVDNPALPGPYAYSTFTYGSGMDKHRDEFGEKIDLQSKPVDASAYISKWPKTKTWFWGFDERQLPLNGTVWMPEGEGPFPVALFVHGNHLMEGFSDGGYAYLCELLASRGFIAVSVDENFLNYSVWSGIPDNDMKVRAWVLLKHLQQIGQFAASEGNPFAGRADLAKVSLIGHSRGGQAVAMAADADKWFGQDATLDSVDGVDIVSVVAIAPTDKQVNDKSARLKDVNYLTLQGARDGDVNTFYGDRQYGRTTFTADSNRFKASLYIADANHSQFNTAWGTMDERLPGGLFLNRRGMFDGEEQREIAKVYISAFLEATLNGREQYTELFRDYRGGLSWLPDGTYVSRYESSEFTEIARFDGGAVKTSIGGGGKASAEGMKDWSVASAEDRDGKSKGTKGIVLSWERPGAVYELELPVRTARVLSSELAEPHIAFSMANMERDLIADPDEPSTAPKDEAEDGQAMDGGSSDSAAAELPPLPEVEIELTTSDGETFKLPLADVMPVAPPIYSAFMSMSWLEERVKDEKYKEANEPVFQTYIVPLEAFGLPDASSEPMEIAKISFVFVSAPGKVMLDDIGIME